MSTAEAFCVEILFSCGVYKYTTSQTDSTVMKQTWVALEIERKKLKYKDFVN